MPDPGVPSSGAEDSLAFHAAAPGGARGYVLLLERSDREGWVRCRRWESPDYTAPAEDRLERTSDVAAAVGGEARAGWRFTLHPDRIRAWLDQSPA